MGADKLFQKKKFHSTKELARRKAKKFPYETILIICEDSKSCCYYLKNFIKHYRLNTASITILPSRGSAPISVIEHAIEIAKNTSDIDQIFCVFDRDQHESFDRALTKISNHKPNRNDKSKPKYRVITSTPSFELWLLLHFHYSTKCYEATPHKSATEALISNVRKVLPSYTKNEINWFPQVLEKIDIAIKHAKQLQAHNLKTGSMNPATNMHELVEYLIKLNQQERP